MEWSDVLLANLLYLCLVAGIWMVSISLITPGSGVYEVLAGLFLLAAGAGLAFASVNLWAAGVLAAGLLCFVLAVFRDGELAWLLGAGLLISVGSVFLFRIGEDIPSVDPTLAAAASLSTIGYYWFALRRVLESRRAAPSVGVEHFIGQTAVVRSAIEPAGLVYLEGELWAAKSDRDIPAGTYVRILGREGLVLKVQAVEPGMET